MGFSKAIIPMEERASAKKNYLPTYHKTLGIIYAIKKFCHYLLGYKLVFHTNHNALKFVMNKSNLTSRIACWMLLLQEFDF